MARKYVGLTCPWCRESTRSVEPVTLFREPGNKPYELVEVELECWICKKEDCGKYFFTYAADNFWDPNANKGAQT